VIQVVDAPQYNDEIALRSELLGGITLPTARTAPTPVPTEGPAPIMSRDELVVFLQRAADDIDGFWTREFPAIANGAVYQPPQGFVPYDQPITPGYGGATPGRIGEGNGPFYCFTDLTVYLDIVFHEDELSRYDPFPVAEAVAHEVGHHVQNLLGLHVCQMSPCLDPTVLTSQELEVMADCFAGAWSADAELRGRLGNFDIENNIAQYALSFGDPHSGAADPGAHGRGALRVYWFLAGYYFGARTCFGASEATAALVTPDPNATPLPAGTLPPGALRAIGDAYQIGALTLTVTGTEQPAAIGDPASAGAKADGKRVVVYFSVTVAGEAAVAW
jgi:predicted metalloprotease